MSKKVLFISYFFPPVGGAGVLRVTKFVKFLPTLSWKPYVLTVKKGFYPLQDRNLLLDIPSLVQTTRVSYTEPGFWFKNRLWQSFLKYFLYPLFLIPDRQILWFWPALWQACKIIKKEKISLVFTSSSSYSDHLIALVLKKTTGIKWVADFRDEWTRSSYFKFPTPIHKKIAQILEKQILKNANKVITISEGLTNSYQKILGSQKDKFATITNGFDQEEIKKIQISKLKSQNKNLKFKIIHAGTFYGERRIDFVTQVFNKLKLKDAHLEFIGAKKQLPHQEALAKMFTADILLLILSPKDGPAVMTSKIFEYLALRKPILAIAPKDSGAATLIEELKVGEVAEPENAEEIKEKLLKLYQKWLENDLKIPEVNLEKYERKKLTEDLVKIFEKLTKKSSKIKLCLIGNAASVHNQNLVNFLKNRNYEVHFISTTKVEIPKVKIYYLGKNYFTPWFFNSALRKIKDLIKEIQPDVVHGQDLVFAGIWANLSGFHPYVVTTWGSDVWKFNTFIFLEKYLIRKTLQEADLVTGSSIALKQQSLKIGMPEKNWQLVHFGINLEVFKRKKILKSLRQKLGINQDQKIIFCPRSIAPVYNTDVLIDTMALIDREANAKLILMGTGAESKYFQKVKEQIKIRNLEEEVIFLKSISREMIVNLYNLADVVVSLTSSDGCSVSFLEAMACEKKIVATELPYIKEWKKGKNLWTVPVREVKATAPALMAALNYPSLKWQKIGRANRQLVLKAAEVNSNFEKLDGLYRELI